MLSSKIRNNITSWYFIDHTNKFNFKWYIDHSKETHSGIYGEWVLKHNNIYNLTIVVHRNIFRSKLIGIMYAS